MNDELGLPSCAFEGHDRDPNPQSGMLIQNCWTTARLASRREAHAREQLQIALRLPAPEDTRLLRIID